MVLARKDAKKTTVRLFLESDVYGREYFNGYADLAEINQAIGRLIEDACRAVATDSIERTVAVCVVPNAKRTQRK